jgi:signal transduction histidine kinase
MAGLKSDSRARLLRSPTTRLVAAGGLLLALVWGVLLWDFQRHADFDYADNRREVESLTQIGAQALSFTVRSIDLMLLDLREHWQQDPGDFDRRVRLRQADARLGIPFAISVIDSDGRVAYRSADPAAARIEPSDPPYPGASRDDGTYGDLTIIRLREDPLTGRRAIEFARPLRTAEDLFAGAIVFSVTPGDFMQLRRSVHVQADTVMTVIRDDGVVLAHTVAREDPASGATATLAGARPAASAPPLPLARPSRLDLSDSGFSTIRSPVDQIERLSGWRRLSPYPLTLMVGEQASRIDGEISRLRLRYLVVGGLASLLLVAALYWRTRTRRAQERAALGQREVLAHLARSADELRASQQQLRELAAHQMVLKEEERKRIAQEIHDELGQRLTVLRMDVSMLPRAVSADPAGLLPGQVVELKASLDGIVALVRDIAGRLRPATLDVGLDAAAEGLVEEFRASLGIPCELDNRLPPGLELDDRLATATFRIIQESLTNVARHADASRVRVVLATKDGNLHIQVHDDGRGLDLESGQPNPSFGLSGMRERAAMLGGKLEITSKPGDGMSIDVRIPLDKATAADATRDQDLPADEVRSS